MTDNDALLPKFDMPAISEPGAPYAAKPARKPGDERPLNLGKAVALPVPDFGDPNRRPSCLEVDFPIAPINALAIPEATSFGVRRRPEYNAHKWFARRGQSVFRSLLISAATGVVPVAVRFAWFTASGRTRKVLKTDLDQAHSLSGAALPGSKLDIGQELDRGAFTPKPGVDAILTWFADTATTPELRQAAALATDLLSHWRTKAAAKPEGKQISFLDELGVERPK